MKRAFGLSVTVLCALLLSATAIAQTSASANASKAALTISTALAKTVEWPVAIRASGQIQAWQEAIVSSRANGLPLVEINVDSGQSVKKGQLLARFDDRTARAELAQAEANLAQAIASANQANTNRDRVLAIRSSGAISEESILQAETQAETARTQVAVARANVDAAKVRLENTLVTAPDSGLVVSRNATLGQAFGAATELFRILRQHRLEWRAEVAASDLSRIAKGQSVVISLPDGSKATGRVRQIAPSINAATRLGVVQVDVDSRSNARTAMFAEGIVKTGQANAVVVPAEAVVVRDGRTFVFSVEGERVKRVLVTTGRTQPELIEIVGGLPAGGSIAVRGAGFLSDGDRVAIAAVAKSAAKDAVKEARQP